MAGLLPTNLKIVSAQLPPDFHGTPAEFQRAIVERLEILSASGTNFFFTGDVEPPGNFGPWLRGLQWWVFDPAVGRYVPLDISASLTALFVIAEAEPAAPAATEAQIWIRTKSNRVLGWYFWDGEIWRPDGQTPPSGPTADRPTDAGDLETFFDTDINVLLHWERGAWRTVSGSPGDVKFVTSPLLADALARNPGWLYLGENDQTFRGRTLGVASKDPGVTPAISYPTDGGITARAQAEVAGSETVILGDDEIPQHTHIVGALQTASTDNTVYFYGVDGAESFVAPGSGPPNHVVVSGDGASAFGNGMEAGGLPGTAAGTGMITSKQLSETLAAPYTDPAVAHDNVSPVKFLWALEKQ